MISYFCAVAEFLMTFYPMCDTMPLYSQRRLMCVQWMLEIILANSLEYVHKIFKIQKYSLKLGVTTSPVWLVSYSYVYRIKYKQIFFLCTKKVTQKYILLYKYLPQGGKTGMDAVSGH